MSSCSQIVGWNHTLARIAMMNNVRVFPCRAADDVGGRAKSPLTLRGYHDAVCDLKQVSLWASQYPNSMYGLPCAPNKIFVVDADRHGRGDGVAALMDLFERHGFDWRTVPCIRTPNNGLHVMFQRPKGLGKTLGKLGRAIDTRDNGYVVLPGSRMADGRQYEILNGTLEQMVEYIAKLWLPQLPDWLCKLVEHNPTPPTQRRLPSSTERLRRQLQGVLDVVKTATSGERNRCLHWAACRFGEAIAVGSISLGDAEALLTQAGACCGLAETEMRSTIRSGLNRTLAGVGHGR